MGESPCICQVGITGLFANSQEPTLAIKSALTEQSPPSLFAVHFSQAKHTKAGPAEQTGKVQGLKKESYSQQQRSEAQRGEDSRAHSS